MNTVHETKWVLPAGIPFEELKGRDLEECVYWLLDAMGARDLEWRTGGSGGGAADGGRDLDAVFHVSSPDGEMEPQRWWVECKGRKDTLEAEAVKIAANNALAVEDLAYLVIVTNTTFSNPSRDWVKTWQASHQWPRVKLWDKTSLERMLSRHPSVVLRLFSEALSPKGRLEASRERFWNKLEYTPPKALQEFWMMRETLVIGPLERVALLANEFAHGSIVQRPWAAQANLNDLIDALEIGLLNVPYLVMRASNSGVEQTPIIQSLAHLIMAALQRVSADQVAVLVLECVGSRDGKRFPDDVITFLLMPILDRISAEMQDVCSADCERFFADKNILARAEDAVETYWHRFRKDGTCESEKTRSLLRIEKKTAPCKVGFKVDQKRMCPLYEIEPRLDNVAKFLAIIERVIEFRFAQARSAWTIDCS